MIFMLRICDKRIVLYERMDHVNVAAPLKQRGNDARVESVRRLPGIPDQM